MKLEHNLIQYTKIKSKCIKDLNVRPENIKLLEENIVKTLSDINHSRILYDPHPRILETKSKINKRDLMKLKSFCTAKKTISKVKRQPPDWEKIIANEATDKGLIWSFKNLSALLPLLVLITKSQQPKHPSNNYNDQHLAFMGAFHAPESEVRHLQMLPHPIFPRSLWIIGNSESEELAQV